MTDVTASSNPFALGGAYGRDIRYQQAARLISSTSSTLPAAGTADGTVVLYKALATRTGAQQDVWWTLIYDASAKYWYPNGDAAPMVRFAAAAFANTVVTTFQAAGLPVTIPLAGDYTVSVEALANNLVAGADNLYGPGRNAVVPPLGYGGCPQLANQSASLHWEADFTTINGQACAVSDTVQGFGWTNNAVPGNTYFTNRRISVKPLRVK